MSSLLSAFKRYRVMAYITGVFLAVMTIWLLVLLFSWMGEGNSFGSFFDEATPKPDLYRQLWTVHGVLYFLYLVTGLDLSFRMKFGVLKTVAILIAGTIPFMSFVAEVIVHRDITKRIATATPN